MKDITVRNYILATTEPILKQTLYGIPTAREMWLKMANQYAARAGDLEHVYYQQMYDIKYDADKGIRNHINKFLIIASKLREVGQPLRDSLLLNKIVHALPESYAQFRARWGETSAVDRTIDNLTLRLIAEEQIIASYQQNVSKDNTAFHASGKIYIYICNT